MPLTWNPHSILSRARKRGGGGGASGRGRSTGTRVQRDPIDAPPLARDNTPDGAASMPGTPPAQPQQPYAPSGDGGGGGGGDAGDYQDPFSSMDPNDPGTYEAMTEAMMGVTTRAVRIACAGDASVPLWGEAKYREALPKLLKRIARGIVGASDVSPEVIIVALLVDGNVVTKVGSRETMPLVDDLTKQALCVRAFAGDGKLLSERYSPALLTAPVPDWMRA